MPLILLAEVSGAIRREVGDAMRARMVVSLLRTLPSIEFVPINDDLARQAAEIAADYALRGMDAVYVAVAQLHDCTLITLDREVSRRAATVIRVQTPAQALSDLTR